MDESETQKGMKNCEAFCNRLRRDNPNLYKQLVQLTKDFQQKSQPINHYHSEMQKLFADHPTVIENVNKLFHHDAKIKSNDPFVFFKEIMKNYPDKLDILQSLQGMTNSKELNQGQLADLFRLQFRDFPDVLKDISQFFKQKKPKIQINWNEYYPPTSKRVKVEELQQQHQHYSQYFANAFQQNREIKNEITLLDKIRTKAFSQITDSTKYDLFFNEVINVIHLFTECIITPFEFIEMFEQHTWFDQEIISDIKSIAFSRASARRQQTQLFKPLKDTDFKNAEHVTGSYVRMHPGYANTVRIDPQLPCDVLNHLWVSVPFGSEDYSFSIMRKNSFEEQLFKIEDEMYEYDLNINSYKRTIKLLERVEQGDLSKYTLQKIMQLRALQSVYKTSPKDQEEVISLWIKNPQISSSILKERLIIKCQELIKSKDIANQNWKNVQKNNFSRSLDHRSFYFKKNEKQYTCFSRFMKEPEERYRQIQHEYLNSLSQLTTIKPLSDGLQLGPYDRIKGPVFSLYLVNRELMQETFEIITFCSQNQKCINSEWVQDVLKRISEGFLNLEFKQGQYNFNELKDISKMEFKQSLEQFGFIEETKQNKHSKDTDSEGEMFELYRIMELESPQINENDVYPQSNLQITQSKLDLFVPQGQSMYGNQGIYIFFRYFYSIYQRLEIAKHDQNPLKYKLLKLALLYYFKESNFKHHDYLAQVFGKQAFLFYTIDKLLIDCCKYLQSLYYDKITEGLLSFLFYEQNGRYYYDQSKIEELQLNNLSYALLEQNNEKQDRVIFRFCFISPALHINYLPIWTQINDQQQLNKIHQTVKHYTTTNPQQYRQGIFLKRNLRKDDNVKKRIVNNQLEWTWFENMKIIDGSHDYIEIK
ncbi:hypothetical protein pb186bvf_014873 [Paramecium bursaria]